MEDKIEEVTLGSGSRYRRDMARFAGVGLGLGLGQGRRQEQGPWAAPIRPGSLVQSPWRFAGLV